MADKSDIAQAINMLMIAFPNYHPESMELTAQLWMATLADLPADLLKASIMACITERGRQFAPSIGEIRDAAIQLLAQREGIPSGYEALKEVLEMPPDMTRRKAIANGTELPFIEERRLAWSHPLIKRVAELLGWPKLFPSDNPVADRAQFLKAYAAELERWLDKRAEHPAIREYLAFSAPADTRISDAIRDVQKRLGGPQ